MNAQLPNSFLEEIFFAVDNNFNNFNNFWPTNQRLEVTLNTESIKRVFFVSLDISIAISLMF